MERLPADAQPFAMRDGSERLIVWFSGKEDDAIMISYKQAKALSDALQYALLFRPVKDPRLAGDRNSQASD